MSALADTPVSLCLSLLHVGAPYGWPTSLRGQLWLHALRLPWREAVRATAVDTMDPASAAPVVREVELTVTQVAELWGLLTACGVPERAPETKPRFDTGDHYSITWIRGSATFPERGTTAFNLELHENSSGIEGPDAPAVSALVRRLCELYDVEHWWLARCCT